jgi:hypothetical protein
MFRPFKWEQKYIIKPILDNFDLLQPNWEIELQLVNVPVQHFAAMTMSCHREVFEPVNSSLFSVMNNSVYSYITIARDVVHLLKDDLSDRVRVLKNNIEAGMIQGCISEGVLMCDLKQASLWAHEHGWELPSPMLKLMSKSSSPIQSEAQISPAFFLPEKLPESAKWRKAFEYESEGLNALYDLIERHYFDANGNPIYDPTQWVLKKNLVSEWLTNRTLDEADTIITSGKRKGKAEK